MYLKRLEISILLFEINSSWSTGLIFFHDAFLIYKYLST